MTSGAATISQLVVYPVKGLSGISLPTARVEPWGLERDRRWMIIDAGGRFLSQRELPQMARIKVEILPGGILLGAGGERRSIPFPEALAPRRIVAVWRDAVPAQVADRDVNEWLGRLLGQSCSLVYMDDPANARTTDPTFANGAPVSFADGFPLLVTSMASLRDLNGRSGCDTPMDRFRPNVVIECAEAWAEDRWGALRAGSAILAVVKPCARCSVTTVEQATGQRSGAEPLRTLAVFRRATDGGARFGQNTVPVRIGHLRVGDIVEEMEGFGDEPFRHARRPNALRIPLRVDGTAAVD
jgi:uncharacterized protein